MTFEFDFILVGLMQIFGFFVQGCTGFGCTVIAAAVTNGLLGTAEGYRTERSSQFHSYTIWA